MALLAYFVFRGVTRSAPEPEQSKSAVSVTATLPEVVVHPVRSEHHTIFASLKGRTEPDRTVTVRSETTGTVTNARISEGQFVKRGTILCGLSVETRAARIAEAQAAVDSARLDHASASTLEEKGWTSSNRAAATKAALDRAEAALAAAKIEMSKTSLRAPFAGIFERRVAEMGDFLSPGAACGEIVDLDPIIVAVDVTESQLDALKLGAAAEITLTSGTALPGNVRYISRSANAQTRTFRIEIESPNPDSSVAAGLTASVRIALGEASAILLTPASLVLHDDGRVGVRYVDKENIIQFAAVQIVDDGEDGIWVTGIPDTARLLSAGQDFVREGIEVTTLSSEGL